MAPQLSDFEQSYLRRALRLARRGEGYVEPNPMVGCVLARGRTLVSEGYHRRYGGPHAEVAALRRAGTAAAGATAYVTLEPCSHFGKTPPCCDALIAAGVKRVVVAMKDPFPEVSGRGIRRLRRAGIQVDVGTFAAEAAELIAPYLTLLRSKRPYTILKWAQSIDGKIATRSGDSQWISCPDSRRLVHRLRSRVDGVLVGIGTVLADDPLLTAREAAIKRTAVRIVLDTRLRMPMSSQLVATAPDVPVLVMTSRPALKTRQRQADRLRDRGVSVVPCRITRSRLDMADALARLGEMRLTNLLVEGGGQVLASLLDRNVADEAHVFVAPRLIGGADAVLAYPGLGAERVSQGPAIREVRSRRIGSDILWRLRLGETPT